MVLQRENYVCKNIQSIVGTISNSERSQTIAASNVIFVCELRDRWILVTETDELEEEDKGVDEEEDRVNPFDPTKMTNNPI